MILLILKVVGIVILLVIGPPLCQITAGNMLNFLDGKSEHIYRIGVGSILFWMLTERKLPEWLRVVIILVAVGLYLFWVWRRNSDD